MTKDDGTDGRHCIIWATGEGLFVAIAAWKVGKGPFKNLAEATTAVAQDLAHPFGILYKFSEDIPDSYWPAKAKSRPEKVEKPKRRKAKAEDSLFEDVPEPKKPADPEPAPEPVAPEPEPAPAPKRRKLLL